MSCGEGPDAGDGCCCLGSATGGESADRRASLWRFDTAIIEDAVLSASWLSGKPKSQLAGQPLGIGCLGVRTCIVDSDVGLLTPITSCQRRRVLLPPVGHTNHDRRSWGKDNAQGRIARRNQARFQYSKITLVRNGRNGAGCTISATRLKQATPHIFSTSPVTPLSSSGAEIPTTTPHHPPSLLSQLIIILRRRRSLQPTNSRFRKLLSVFSKILLCAPY